MRYLSHLSSSLQQIPRSNVSAADSPLKRLQSKVNVDSVSGETFQQFVGEYSYPSKELVGASLSGEYLYLFPDGTYIYCEWSDVEPVTVRDKGMWKLQAGLIALQSDQEIEWDPGAEREYVAVRRAHHGSEILLVGTKNALTYFEKNAADEPGIHLLVVAMKRSRTFSTESATRVKTELMLESWRPQYFHETNQVRHWLIRGWATFTNSDTSPEPARIAVKWCRASCDNRGSPVRGQ